MSGFLFGAALTPCPAVQLVPILPVVTKSDTMTIKESIQYRTELHRKLQFPLLPGRRGGIHLFQFSEDAMANCLPNNAIAHAAAMRPPFLVVCSNFYNKDRLTQSEPELWPERKSAPSRPAHHTSHISHVTRERRSLLQPLAQSIFTEQLVYTDCMAMGVSLRVCTECLGWTERVGGVRGSGGPGKPGCGAAGTCGGPVRQ